MEELPTRQALEQLYHDKGREALVWYAWRNALRALPVLGSAPPSSLWQQQTVQHTFAVCRIALILTPNNLTAAYAAAYPAAKAANAAKAAYPAAYAATYAATYAADAAAYAANAADAADAAANAADAVANTAYAATYAADADRAAARADYEWLLTQARFSTAQWYSQPLWQIGEPLQIRHWRETFVDQLRELGLDFLADDLNQLWQGQPLGAHAVNYLKNFSEAELNDPQTLRRLILQGETAEYIHAVRVLLLGPGGAGKSSLADRLQGNPVNAVKNLTVGVNYQNHQPLDLYATFAYLQQGYKPLDVYLWDFGGQTIFHGLHSAFLHENCVYVLVVDSRHEQAPDEWLHQIRHLTAGKAKVLLVTNWYEGCETQQNETRLQREFTDLLTPASFFYFSCHNANAAGFKTFVQTLEQACLDSQRMVLKETLNVHQALQNSFQDSVFLDEDTLYDTINTHARSETDTVIDKLEQLGFLVKVERNNAHYCLKPEWAVDSAYQILYDKTLRTAAGVLTLTQLQNTFTDKQIARKHTRYLVEFLQARSLCCDLEQKQATYFFPDAAPANEPVAVSKALQSKQRLVIRFDLPFLPLGFHARLISALFGRHAIDNVKDIWRQGFILHKGSNRAVVHYLPRKSEIEIMLVGEWNGYADLLNVLLVQIRATLGRNIPDEQIIPSVILNEQTFSVCSSEQLVDVLSGIQSYKDLIKKVKEMANKNISVNIGDNSQVAIDAHNIIQKYNTDNNTIEINADQRQQLAVIVDALFKQISTLSGQQIMGAGKVKQALEEADTKPESRHLLGKVWNGLKDVLDVTKTSTEIATFVEAHPALIAGAISAVTSLIP